MGSQAEWPSWDEPKRSIDPSQPFQSEFPGLLCWNDDDQSVSHIIDCQNGQVPYLRGTELGSGGFARVYKVIRETDSRLFAGKASKFGHKLRDEARVLRRLRHDHILKYEDFYEDKTNPAATMLLTEICAGGDLNTHINYVTRGMSPVHILRVIKQMADALTYLHGQSMFHSDLKPRNILIRSLKPMNVVLGDCADIKKVGTRVRPMGTAPYYSPELVENHRHMGTADDVWALGVSVLGMMAQWPRFRMVSNGSRWERKLDEYPLQCWEHAGQLAELNPGHGIVILMEKMLAWRVEERITAGELREMAEEALQRWERVHGDGEGELEVKTPEGFSPIEFW